VVMMVLSHSHASVRDSSMEGAARRAVLHHAREWLGTGFEEEAGRLVWAHDSSGRCLGRVDDTGYRQGVSRWDRERVSYFVVAAAGVRRTPSDPPPLHITLEHPAAAPANRRERIEFHTLLHP